MYVDDSGTTPDFALARFDGGDLNVVGQQQVSTQLQQLEGVMTKSGQPDQIGFQAATSSLPRSRPSRP
jgi:hypothetical protein